VLSISKARALVCGAIVSLLCTTALHAQELFSPFVPSEMDDVKRMLKIANLRDNDVVYDLGSGDGRIVMEAARMNKTVRGRGIEIDERLVEKANAVAKENGLHERVKFLHQNAFDADLKEATVITMWLFPELMRLLRPKIMAEARPGTRVVTRTWDLAGWTADRKDESFSPVYLWIVPAKVGGAWTWDLTIGKEKRTYHAVIDQWFQKVEGAGRVGSRRGLFDEFKLEGDRISFVMNVRLDGLGVTRHQFDGRVAGDVIDGTVKIVHDPNQDPQTLPWRARRAHNPSGYFAPTGVNIK
jgi:hypothetical protein